MQTSASSTNAPDADSDSTVARFDWKWNLSELEPPKEGAPTVFSCFACGGGSSMGYKRAGFDVIGNCEIDPRIAKIYEANLHPRHSYVMDLRAFNELEDLPSELYDLDILDGSPPCSTFSMAGNREDDWGRARKFAEGQSEQTLDDLFFVFLETVEKLMPRIVIAENVTGLLRGNARGYVNQIIKRFHDIGYDVQLFKLNSAFMDVPQVRERVFFVANRCGYPRIEMRFDCEPIPFGKVRTPNGVDNDSRDLALAKRYARESDRAMQDIKMRERGKYSGYLVKIIHDDEVAPTQATRPYIRFCDCTYMSKGDIVNVSTFPQDYDFGEDASRSKVAFICGMSVPPNMMAHIASEIRRQWLV